MPEIQSELLATLKNRFGYAWFTPAEFKPPNSVGHSKRLLNQLHDKGLLSRRPYKSGREYRLKNGKKNGLAPCETKSR